MFMPLGLSLVGRVTDHADEYIAWSWAVNGFFSVIGSVLTTILAMSYGFSEVQYFALAAYLVAAVSLTRYAARREPHGNARARLRVSAPGRTRASERLLSFIGAAYCR